MAEPGIWGTIGRWGKEKQVYSMPGAPRFLLVVLNSWADSGVWHLAPLPSNWVRCSQPTPGNCPGSAAWSSGQLSAGSCLGNPKAMDTLVGCVPVCASPRDTGYRDVAMNGFLLVLLEQRGILLVSVKTVPKSQLTHGLCWREQQD